MNKKILLSIELFFLLIFLFFTTRIGSLIIGDNLYLFGPTTFQEIRELFAALIYLVLFSALILSFVFMLIWYLSSKDNKKWIKIEYFLNDLLKKFSANINFIFYNIIAVSGPVFIVLLNFNISQTQIASFFIFSVLLIAIIDTHVKKISEFSKDKINRSPILLMFLIQILTLVALNVLNLL